MPKSSGAEGIFFVCAVERITEVTWAPCADIYRTEHGWVVKFELAGVRPEEISVGTRGHELVISGLRRDCPGAHASCERMEIAYGAFERVLELPVDLTDIPMHSDYRDGMLRVSIGEGL